MNFRMATELAQRVSFVKSKLLSEHTIKVKNNWITECVAFFLSSGDRTYSDDELYDEVFEQFINSDVKDSSNPVIPAIVTQKKEPFTLHGTFVLQMMYLIDVCKLPA